MDGSLWVSKRLATRALLLSKVNKMCREQLTSSLQQGAKCFMRNSSFFKEYLRTSTKFCSDVYCHYLWCCFFPGCPRPLLTEENGTMDTDNAHASRNMYKGPRKLLNNLLKQLCSLSVNIAEMHLYREPLIFLTVLQCSIKEKVRILPYLFIRFSRPACKP